MILLQHIVLSISSSAIPESLLTCLPDQVFPYMISQSRLVSSDTAHLSVHTAVRAAYTQDHQGTPDKDSCFDRRSGRYPGGLTVPGIRVGERTPGI